MLVAIELMFQSSIQVISETNRKGVVDTSICLNQPQK